MYRVRIKLILFLLAYSHLNGARLREDNNGVDDGFGPFNPSATDPEPPTNGEPRHSPFPPSPSPRRPAGPGGYTPVPSGGVGVAWLVVSPRKIVHKNLILLHKHSQPASLCVVIMFY